MPIGLGRIPPLVVVVLVLGCALNGKDILKEARSLATNKQRGKALEMLQRHLRESPEDVDARLLYGLVLSWESRWDPAREAIETVLAGHPSYADAALALTNVELWSDHADRAEEVMREFLERQPNNVNVMLARVRVMRALNRKKDGLALTRDILRLE